MKKYVLWYACMIVCAAILCIIKLSAPVYAQASRTVTGTVVSKADGKPLPGVKVVVKGSVRGAVTDKAGSFSITAQVGQTLVATLVGYKKAEAKVPQEGTVNIELTLDEVLLDEVVVTAIGIERERKSLGYAISTVQGESLTQARELNVANALVGRVAGVRVNIGQTGPGGSSRVIIRGEKQLTGNNQPLYVVDGIPIDNESPNQAGQFGGTDFGDGIQSINPDDIETISVLKGAAASALYGTRAQNGVIVITTKKGVAREGIGVEYNGNLTFDTPLVLPDYQNEYGHGDRGVVPATQTAVLLVGTNSWGARMDGSEQMFFDGVRRPYIPQPNNIRDFYQTGRTVTNTVSLVGGNQASNFRFSISNMDNVSIVPNTSLNRLTLTLRGQAQLGERIMADVKANYIREYAPNRPSLSDAADNPARSLNALPRSIDINWLRDYRNPNPTSNLDIQRRWQTRDNFSPNPFWSVYENRNPSFRDRLIATALVRYQVAEPLSVMVRAGRDAYNYRQALIDPQGTLNKPDGDILERNIFQEEINADFLITYDQEVFDDLRLTVNAGGNTMFRKNEQFSILGQQFITRNFFAVTNTVVREAGYALNQKMINSFYGSATFSYKDYLFVEVTARNDWSSTLPLNNNSYFYPSVNATFNVTEAFGLQKDIPLAKVRASWAQVGGDTDPYQLELLYAFAALPYTAGRNQNMILAQAPQFNIPNSQLKPTISNNIEAGIDLKLLDGRLGFDITYYQQDVRNQIIPITISPTTGFTGALINAGRITNEGIEVMVTGIPIRTPEFTWETSFNIARNWNLVAELYPGIRNLDIGAARVGATVLAVERQAYGVIRGVAFLRDSSQAGFPIVYDARTGLPVRDPIAKDLGNAIPDAIGGWSNTFSFFGFTLSALIDFRVGGKIFSLTNANAYIAGQHKGTLVGREGARPDSILAVGVMNVGTTAAPMYVQNTRRAYVQDFWTSYGGVTEAFMYDATFVKLREVTLGYNLTQSDLRDTFLSGILTGARISVVMRNAAILLSNIPNVDPESNYSNGNAQGLEYNSLPSTRSVGVNLTLKF
ncbi:MAG: SusC/RagA family TonB-linked outer membrane protein [Bacteroidota bacterium]|nr:SusC/RagA family TonB-linked outer membrane protein [Candidatus Kapabacteria bacterium]MDW8219338.1 SusC/RagA family TonB-linked outer membrane protein [Bacteroidota bacterium]